MFISNNISIGLNIVSHFFHGFIYLVPNLELGALKRQLIGCTTANAVRALLVKCTNLIISEPNLSLEPWHINPSWIMPIQIKSVLLSLPRGFLQDFTYILISKAKDFAPRQVIHLFFYSNRDQLESIIICNEIFLFNRNSSQP